MTLHMLGLVLSCWSFLRLFEVWLVLLLLLVYSNILNSYFAAAPLQNSPGAGPLTYETCRGSRQSQSLPLLTLQPQADPVPFVQVLPLLVWASTCNSYLRSTIYRNILYPVHLLQLCKVNIAILPVVAKDLPVSPRFLHYEYLSRWCKFSSLTVRQLMVEFYSVLITFSRFPLR